MSGQEPEYAYWEMLAEGLREHGVKDFAYEYWKALADRADPGHRRECYEALAAYDGVTLDDA